MKAYEHAGKFDLARAEFDAWMQVKGRTEIILANRAGFFIRTGQFDAALQDLNEADRLNAAQQTQGGSQNNLRAPRTHQCMRIWALYLKGDGDRALAEADAFPDLRRGEIGASPVGWTFNKLSSGLAGDCSMVLPLLLSAKGQASDAVKLAGALTRGLEKAPRDFPLVYYVRAVAFEAAGDQPLAYLEYSRFLGSKLTTWDEKCFVAVAIERKAKLEAALAAGIASAEADCRQYQDEKKRRAGCAIYIGSGRQSAGAYAALGATYVMGPRLQPAAMEAFDEAIALDPRNAAALVMRGRERRKNYSGKSDAEADFKAALAADPGNLVAKLELTVLDVDDAELPALKAMLDQLNTLVKSNSSSIDALVVRGEIKTAIATKTMKNYTEQERNEAKQWRTEAREDFEAANVLARERDPLVLEKIGAVAGYLGDSAGKFRALEQALTLRPEDSHIRFERAQHASIYQAPAIAVSDYTILLASGESDDGKIVDWRFRRGEAHLALKDYPKAIADFTVAADARTEAGKPGADGDYMLAQALRQRGRAHLLMQEPAVAVVDYRAAIDALPEHGDRKAPVEGLANALLANGECDGAQKELSNVLDKDKAPVSLLTVHGIAKQCLGDFRGAAAEYTLLISTNSEASTAREWRMARARSNVSLNRHDTAMPEIDELIAATEVEIKNVDKSHMMHDLMTTLLNRRAAELMVLRGRAQFQSGQLPEALQSLRGGVARDEKIGSEAWFDLGYVLIAQGECVAAEKEMQTGLEKDGGQAGMIGLGVAKLCAGDSDGAAAAFLQSLQAGRMPAYAATLRFIALARKGEAAADKDLKANVAKLSDKGWPAPVIEMMLGTRDPDALPLAASNDDQRCEAKYYAAAYLQLKGEMDGARTGYQQAGESCRKDFIEYGLAVNDLKKLSATKR